MNQNEVSRKLLLDENRALKEKSNHLREKLAQMELNLQDKIQSVQSLASDEINQLKATINSLRDKMEDLVEKESENIQKISSGTANELYSRVAQGDQGREIRIMSNAGIAGHVFTNRKGIIIFINDEKTNELYTEVGEGLGKTIIRFPNHLGIAGSVFTSKETINIPYAYADLRFNPGFDRQTGFFTRSILCSPVFNKKGKVIGDGVNLAARLESACKQYGAKILISEYTYNSLKGTYRTRMVDKVIVKGKTKPLLNNGTVFGL